RSVSEKYALVYFFSDSLKVRRKAESFCEKHGLKLVMIPYAKQEFNLTDQRGPGFRHDNVGPAEFVSLVRNADFVLTDSFHGAVFSIIHQIPFAVFERSKAGHVSMNSRLYDLLDIFDEKHRLIDVGNICKLDSLIEVYKEKILRILREKKNESLSFLKNAIEKGINEADSKNNEQ
ncbi:MAG: polysaccharide pyruvyl transferase family protein, partial [Synergistaceae bacterium]|nr:polysaccharide pyruvyl transferase family protein [Synergistaceae bacterium]